MPTQKSRYTKIEDQAFRRNLSELEELGLVTGSAGDPSPEPDAITLEQIEVELPYIYQLSFYEVAVVVSAKMTVPKSGVLITDAAMTTPWDECSLDLWDPVEGPSSCKKLVNHMYHSPPSLLNPWLTHEGPLNARQVKGCIVAHGSGSVPARCHDETLVTVTLLLELSLGGEPRKELSFDFGVRVNRSAMRKCEQRHRANIAALQSIDDSDLYEPKRGQTGGQKSVSPAEAIKQPYPGGGMTQPPTGNFRNGGRRAGVLCETAVASMKEADTDVAS